MQNTPVNNENKNIKNNKNINLGEGNIKKLLFKLAIPTIIAQLVNLLYNMVDRIYIGHIKEVGGLALTGLGLCFPVLVAITAFSYLFGSGGAPRAAIFMGEGDNDKAERVLGNCFASLLATAIILTIVLEITGKKILYMFGASDNTITYAMDYLRIYLLGTVFVMLTLGLNLFITTQGFSKISMITVLIGAGTNIILDPILIFGLNMGVKGAAFATIISQALSAIWGVSFLLGKKTKLKIRYKYFRIDKAIILPVLALGVSPFIMNLTESLINIAFNYSLSKYGGDVAVGAMTILTSIMQLQFMPVQGLGQGAQPIISFNYGAGNIERVKKTFMLLIRLCVTYTFIFWIFLELFPGFFIRLFNDDSEKLYETAVWMLRLYVGATGIFGLQMAIQQTFMALSEAKISLIIACMRKIVLLIPLIFIIPNFFENKVFGVILAEPVSDFLSVTIAVTLFSLNINKILHREKR